MSANTTKAGFTLIELLVVVSIIALLVGILLPGLDKARDAARSMRSLANLKQIGIGHAAYQADHHQYVVAARYLSVNTSGRTDHLPDHYVANTGKSMFPSDYALLGRYTQHVREGTPWWTAGGRTLAKGVWLAPNDTSQDDGTGKGSYDEPSYGLQQNQFSDRFRRFSGHHYTDRMAFAIIGDSDLETAEGSVWAQMFTTDDIGNAAKFVGFSSSLKETWEVRFDGWWRNGIVSQLNYSYESLPVITGGPNWMNAQGEKTLVKRDVNLTATATNFLDGHAAYVTDFNAGYTNGDLNLFYGQP